MFNYLETFSYKTSAGKPVLFQIAKWSLGEQSSGKNIFKTDSFDIYLITSGSGQLMIDFNERSFASPFFFSASPGQEIILKADHVNGLKISFNKDFYCVETHGKEIACNGILFNNVHVAAAFQLTLSQFNTLQQYVEKMIYELQNPGKAHRDMLETYLRLLLIDVLRFMGVDESTGTNGNKKSHLAEDFIALVNKHFKTKHSVSDYAEMLYITPKSLTKHLQAKGYSTPSKLIKERILVEAKRILRHTDFTIKEIAYDLGFEDPAYFSRYFSKTEQISPLEYRAAYLANT